MTSSAHAVIVAWHNWTMARPRGSVRTNKLFARVHLVYSGKW